MNNQMQYVSMDLWLQAAAEHNTDGGVHKRCGDGHLAPQFRAHTINTAAALLLYFVSVLVHHLEPVVTDGGLPFQYHTVRHEA